MPEAGPTVRAVNREKKRFSNPGPENPWVFCLLSTGYGMVGVGIEIATPKGLYIAGSYEPQLERRWFDECWDLFHATDEAPSVADPGVVVVVGATMTGTCVA